MIESRFYNVQGVKWEARFFRKGESFPDTPDLTVPRQGVWARPVRLGWSDAIFAGDSWKNVGMELDVVHIRERSQER